MFKLRFDPTEVPHWAAKYPAEGDRPVEKLLPAIKARGQATKAEFLAICRWKSPRPLPYYQRNSEAFVRAVTGVAFSTPNERLRIEVLTLLSGVSWPVASVFLHFCHRDPYPILDAQALWSVGVEIPPRVDFAYWWDYTEFCRDLAAASRVSMRDLDRALWAYSSQHQAGKRGK